MLQPITLGAHRATSTIWVTRIAKVMANERNCHWGAVHEIRGTYPKQATIGDLSGWVVKHTALVHTSRRTLPEEGYAGVFIEDQNWFQVHNRERCVIIGGKPDLRAVRPSDRTLLIGDAKTGARRSSDLVQVKIGMLLAASVWGEKFPGYTAIGRVIYPDGHIDIPADSIDDEFRMAFRQTVAILASADEQPRTPSMRECQFCPIGPAHCPDRIDAADIAVLAEAGVF